MLVVVVQKIREREKEVAEGQDSTKRAGGKGEREINGGGREGANDQNWGSRCWSSLMSKVSISLRI